MWNARGDAAKVDQAAHSFAEAIGALCGVLVEALVMWAASVSIGKAFAVLKGTRFGDSFQTSEAGAWLSERVATVKSGGSKLPTPKDAKNAWTAYSWNRTAIARRLQGLFGDAAPLHFEPIGANKVSVHGELKISGAALERLSDADLAKLVQLCEHKAPEADYLYFESSSSNGGKPGARLRFESRLDARAAKVQQAILDSLGVADGDPRAKLFENLSDGEKVRLWDLFNEQAFKNAELRKAAAEWAFGKKPKTARELVAQMQFFEAEVNRLSKELTKAVDVEIAANMQEAAVAKGSNLSGAEERSLTRTVTERLLGRALDGAGPAADRAARAKVQAEMHSTYRPTLERNWKLNLQAQRGANSAGTLDLGNKGDAELPSAIKANADRLSFGNQSDGAYHAHKHAGELSAEMTPENEMASYLREARRLLRDHLGVVRVNQSGTRSVVVEAGGRRVIVTVADGKASIATFGAAN